MKQFSNTLALVAAVSALAAACGSTSASIAESSKPREANPTVAAGDVETLVHGDNNFALDLYQSLRAEDGNLILSPYSISLALGMTSAGARGETESQMAATLHFDLPQARLHSAFNALDVALEESPAPASDDQQPMQLKIANAVWADQTYTFLQEFLDILAVNYGAGIHLADFVNQFEPARKDINNWVSDQTEDKIKDLLPQGSLDSDTRMVLVNAIYFKADWLSPFTADSTDQRQFHRLDGSQVTVDMMHRDAYMPYLQGSGYQAIELAYAGGTAAMDIIVPDDGNFEAFDTSFNKAGYDEIVNGLQPASVTLGLPKFEFTKDFSLPDTLKSMGMIDPFDAARADFSGMTGRQDLFIGDVVHKAFVKVDEKGTEAAAATGVVMQITSAQIVEHDLQIDRPFIMVIREAIHGQILFIGRVTDPTH